MFKVTDEVAKKLKHKFALAHIKNANSSDIIEISNVPVLDTVEINNFEKFVNNNVHIYLDNNYTDNDNMIIDATKTCNAICNVIGHEFVAVLECKKVNK